MVRAGGKVREPGCRSLPRCRARDSHGHCRQDVAPLAFWKLPAGQSVQAVPPVPPWYRPARHGRGASMLGWGHFLPGGHSVHADAPAAA